MLAVVAATVLALAVSACGGGSSSGGSSGGGSTKPTQKLSGSPIKAMTVASVNTSGPPFPQILETANLYGKWVNDHGGINGHPLQVITCDDRGVAPGATQCARQAVSQKVVAVVGSYTFMTEALVPVLAKAGIAWFGNCCPGTPSELTGKNSFPVGSGPLYATGFTKRAIDDGCKKINAVIIDGAQPYIPLMEGAMKAAGRTFAHPPIILPATSQDYSPQVAQATSGGADCVLMVVSEGPYKAWMGPWAQSGTKARMYGPQGNLDATSIQGNEQAAEGSVIAGSYPDISTAPWKDFRAAIKTYNANPKYDYNSLSGLGTWSGYTAFKKIIEASVKGDVTAKTFMDAVSKTTHLDMNGMVPTLNFTKEWTANPPYRRLFNRSVVFSQVKGGKIVPLTTNFEDVSAAALGQ
jgi:ABC-type branched-subunit amino acid transport system substrate-binding protein